MKLVVDSNCIQSNELRSFLQKSVKNKAVLPDFTAMEAYKGDTLSKIFKSMEIVSEYPSQVLILKGSAKISALSGRLKGLQRRLIDEKQTQEFPEYTKALVLGKNGNPRIQQQLLSYGNSAQSHLDKMLQEAEEMKPTFDALTKLYTKEERAIIRVCNQYTSEMIKKLGETLIEISSTIFKNSPLIHKAPTYQELANTFYFRVALCNYLMIIRRGALGGSSGARADKIRNDMVDMMIVAYATYFDGILSKETNVNRMYMDACLMLSGLFGAEVPSLAKYGLN